MGPLQGQVRAMIRSCETHCRFRLGLALALRWARRAQGTADAPAGLVGGGPLASRNGPCRLHVGGIDYQLGMDWSDSTLE